MSKEVKEQRGAHFFFSSSFFLHFRSFHTCASASHLRLVSDALIFGICVVCFIVLIFFFLSASLSFFFFLLFIELRSFSHVLLRTPFSSFPALWLAFTLFCVFLFSFLVCERFISLHH